MYKAVNVFHIISVALRKPHTTKQKKANFITLGTTKSLTIKILHKLKKNY